MQENENTPRVYFVGAGPGDPDLITKKGDNLIKKADHIIYTGSLVNEELLSCAKKDSKIQNSASMTKEEIITSLVESAKNNNLVVRLHTGDPSLYGAIQEQLDELYEKGIDTEVIPGISAFQGSAASLKRELTLPGITQTVVLSRVKGKTSRPEEEDLKDLALLNSTLCLYLSIQDIDKVANELIQGGLKESTPAAVIYKATWPEEKIIQGNLKNIATKVKEERIEKTALIIVGEILKASKDNYYESKLYHPEFEHAYRSPQNKGDSNLK